MKTYSKLLILMVAIGLVVASCYRDKTLPVPPVVARTIRFVLHTDEDLSDNNSNVTFSMFIRTHDKVLFDTTLSVMKIKDIPDSTRKLVFEKKVPNDDGSELAAGFRYTIENVGNSTHIDTCKAGELFKVVDFSFK
jgi:hypothetical protein